MSHISLCALKRMWLLSDETPVDINHLSIIIVWAPCNHQGDITVGFVNRIRVETLRYIKLSQAYLENFLFLQVAIFLFLIIL